MDQELNDRFVKIEQKLVAKNKDIWDKIQNLSSVFIPVAIALVGWYYTNQNTSNQLEIQKLNNENDYQIALVNSNVGQSEMIKDFMQHLTSQDTAVRNIAIEAILYAAPTPGKKIVEVLSRSHDTKTRSFANDALANKRNDLVSNLFSDQKQTRLAAANEIVTNWADDEKICIELLNRTNECLTKGSGTLNCEDGIFNVFTVLPSFSKSILHSNKERIASIIDKIPIGYAKTSKLANDLLKQF